MNADLYVFASAAFAPKSNIADGSISIDSSTLKQKDKGVICNSTAGTG